MLVNERKIVFPESEKEKREKEGKEIGLVHLVVTPQFLNKDLRDARIAIITPYLHVIAPLKMKVASATALIDTPRNDFRPFIS